jgi:hypothetical protein
MQPGAPHGYYYNDKGALRREPHDTPTYGMWEEEPSVLPISSYTGEEYDPSWAYDTGCAYSSLGTEYPYLGIDGNDLNAHARNTSLAKSSAEWVIVPFWFAWLMWSILAALPSALGVALGQAFYHTPNAVALGVTFLSLTLTGLGGALVGHYKHRTLIRGVRAVKESEHVEDDMDGVQVGEVLPSYDMA